MSWEGATDPSYSWENMVMTLIMFAVIGVAFFSCLYCCYRWRRKPDKSVERQIITERILVVCPYCGAKIQQGVSFCPHCGGRI